MDFYAFLIVWNKEVIQMISSAYNYYLSNYVGREVSKYDTHKKSELRDIYNRIVKANKNSSFYKINDSDDVKKYAIDLKETARELNNIASELSEEGLNSGFSRKQAFSEDDSIISVKYVGEEATDETVQELQIGIDSLAKTQINKGHSLRQNEIKLPEGAYSFDFSISEYTYEFQFNVTKDDTNRSVQDKLMRLINRSNIGVKAEVVENSLGDSAIVIESESTGISNMRGTIFNISSSDSGSKNAVSYFGLDRIVQEPENAKFTINGLEKTSSSNTFTISKQYMVSLNGVSGENIVKIGLKSDFDAVLDNVNQLIEKYNSVVDLAKEKVGDGFESEKLYRDMKGIALRHKDELESAGFRVLDDGKIKVEEAILLQAAENGEIEDNLKTLSEFRKHIQNKAYNISVNPMEYVDKKLIAYKNPGKTFANPYMSSMYSGMMFNGYV